MMKRRVKIVCSISCLILSFLLEGCISLYTGRWTSVNLGGALNNVEHKRPCKQQVLDDKGQWRFHTRVWKKGERYIVEVPVAFVPFNPPLIEHSAGHRRAEKSLDNRYWGPNEEEIAQYPTELYYADLSHRQFKHLCKIRKSDLFRNPFPSVKLTPASEMDFSNTTLILDTNGANVYVRNEEMNQFGRIPNIFIIRTHSIPPRRSTLNYCLQPICWVAEVVDIPLTLIATPIGWVVDAIYEPLHN